MAPSGSRPSQDRGSGSEDSGARLAPRARAQPAAVGPQWIAAVVITTLTGALAILFLATCNRVPSLENVANRLERRIAEEQSIRLQLAKRLAEGHAAPDLARFAEAHGLTERQPPLDKVDVPAPPPSEHETHAPGAVSARSADSASVLSGDAGAASAEGVAVAAPSATP